MTLTRVSVPVLAVVALTACASGPKGPSVMVLPGAGKSLEQFKADESACRQWAGQQTGSASGETAQRQYDVAYQQCMYAKGNQIPGGASPAAATPTTPAPSTPAGPGAPGTGPSEAFMTKMQRIQTTLPAWLEKTGRQAEVGPLMQRLDQDIRAKNFQSAEAVADQVLKLMDSN